MIELFITFIKIGLFTFGGGYAMISLVKEECIEKRHWVTDEEFINMLAIAEATPGPIAINMATYVGYKKAKMFGAIIATIGVILPSMVIIYLISLFIDEFLKIKIISYAFFGIRVAVAIIILRTGINLIVDEHKKSSHKVLTIILFLIFTSILFISELLSLGISSIVLILAAIVIAVILSLGLA